MCCCLGWVSDCCAGRRSPAACCSLTHYPSHIHQLSLHHPQSDQKRSPAPSAAFPAQRRAVLRSLLQASPFCAALPLVVRKDGNCSAGFTQAVLLLCGSLGGRGRSSPPPVLALQLHTCTVRAWSKLGARRPRRTGAVTSRGPLVSSQALVVDGAGSVEGQPRAEVSETSLLPPVSPLWSPASPG